MLRVVFPLTLLSAATICFSGRRILCYQCASHFLGSNSKQDHCLNPRTFNMTQVECEKDDVCMKMIFNAAPDYLVYRDCADAKEACDKFTKRIPIKAPKVLEGTVKCAVCYSDSCNSSNIIHFQIVICVVLLFVARLFS